jgi:hypothetical protein
MNTTERIVRIAQCIRPADVFKTHYSDVDV